MEETKNTETSTTFIDQLEGRVKSKSYSLHKEHGGWLGQIILTSDGMFSSVTDYGNFAYAWRSFGGDDFRKFITGLNTEYFAGKMYQGMSYVAYGKKIDQACKQFAEQILPALKQELLKDIEQNPNW